MRERSLSADEEKELKELYQKLKLLKKGSPERNKIARQIMIIRFGRPKGFRE